MSAIRRFVAEAADNKLIAHEVAEAIGRIKGPRRVGQPIGRWLNSEEATCLIRKPPAGTLKGKRDRAILAMLVGTGLRREELTSLCVHH